MIERPLHVTKVIPKPFEIGVIGEYLDGGDKAAISLGRHAFALFWQSWSAAGHPQPVLHDAMSNTLRWA